MEVSTAEYTDVPCVGMAFGKFCLYGDVGNRSGGVVRYPLVLPVEKLLGVRGPTPGVRNVEVSFV